jgi:hypothetical protein
MKPTKHCLKKAGRRRGNGNIMDGMNLFKPPCTHVWNYSNEIPFHQCMIIQK